MEFLSEPPNYSSILYLCNFIAAGAVASRNAYDCHARRAEGRRYLLEQSKHIHIIDVQQKYSIAGKIEVSMTRPCELARRLVAIQCVHE